MLCLVSSVPEAPPHRSCLMVDSLIRLRMCRIKPKRDRRDCTDICNSIFQVPNGKVKGEGGRRKVGEEGGGRGRRGGGGMFLSLFLSLLTCSFTSLSSCSQRYCFVSFILSKLNLTLPNYVLAFVFTVSLD